MNMFLIWLFFAIAAALIASSRERSVIGWFVIGFLFGPFGLLFAFFMKHGEDIRKEEQNILSSKNDGKRTIERSFKNNTYFINILNYNNEDFKYAKDELLKQYKPQGYDTISIDIDTVWSLKNSQYPRTYIQVVLKNNIMKIEVYNAQSEPSLYKNLEKEESKSNNSTADKLLKLAELLEKKLITQDEFDQQKKILLK